MAERTPKHGLTGTSRGWVKRVNGKPTWIVGRKICPTPSEADSWYEAHFSKIWQPSKAEQADDLTVADLCDLYIQSRRHRHAAGKCDDRTLADTIRVLTMFAESVGGNRRATALTPTDFAKVTAAWSGYGYSTRKRRIQAVRSMFRWATLPPHRMVVADYGEAFGIPAKLEQRRERAHKRATIGLMKFEPADIQAQLGGVVKTRGNGRPMTLRLTPAMRAMILLGLNCGFGNSDIAKLPIGLADLKAGVIEYPRHKTGVDRKAFLWPETVDALRAYLARRPKPAKAKWAGLLFLTRFGQPYVRHRRTSESRVLRIDKIAERYRLLLKNCGQVREGRNFYSLRRTARTIAAETGEERAIDLVFGHAENAGDMGSIYTLAILDDKVLKVCNHVRSRLLGVTAEPS